MSARMAFMVIDRMFLLVHGAEDPTNEEWALYLDAIQRHGVDRTMLLVYTDGGGPSAMQRRYLNELLNGRTVPVAVLSDSAKVRGLVTVMSWFNPQIRAFSPAELVVALAYLEVPTSRAELIEREKYELRLSLGAQHGRERERSP
jgi:hypothetical protein